MVPVQRDCQTAIRPVRPSDSEILTLWFSNAEFVRWWGGVPKSSAEVAEKYLGRRTSVRSFIIEHNGQACGYIQAWRENDDKEESGIDIALVPEKKGFGIGPSALSLLAKILWSEGFRRITVDPHYHNASAIRAFAKSGFRRKNASGEHVIMVFNPERSK